MKTPELDSILKQARMPEIPEESLTLFPRRVVPGIRRPEPPVRAARNLRPRFFWAFGLAACCVIALTVVYWPGKTGKLLPEADSLASAKLVRETQALFPNRVRAIVQDEHGLNVVLSDTDDVPDSTPLYVHICDGKHCSSAVTFSGQEIQLSGRKISVLAEAGGGIILEGNKFVWSSTSRDYALKGLKIEARPLPVGTM